MISKHLRRALAMFALCAVLTGSLTVSASAASFQDVPASHWAAGEIQECVELGFFKGQSATHFGLGQSMTRSAFTVVLCRFFGWETPAPTQTTYADVPTDAWYAGAVEAAYTHGALTRQQGTFRPNDPITREELTVMLVRAMGYSTMAGLAQEQPLPFGDVDTNAGYITLAYGLGLMNGTSATTFAPTRAASREQVAVILMRLYRKLHSDPPTKTAILTATETIPNLAEYSVVAIPAARLLYTRGVSINNAMDAEMASALRDAAQQAGAITLLHVTGGTTALKGTASETAAALTTAVIEGGYDGLFLDIPKLKIGKAAALSSLTAALRTKLGDKPLYLMIEAPAWQGSSYTGYGYALLSQSADQLVLRIAPYAETSSSLAIAPVDPLEEVYYALETLRNTVPADKLALLLTTDGTLWRKNDQKASLTSAEIQTLLEEGTMHEHYSGRYACAYLTGAEKNNASETVWYLNGQAAAERIQMLRLFGISQLCISDLSTTSEDLLSGLQ